MTVGDAVGEVDFTIPVSRWREGEGAVLVVFESALTVSDFEVDYGEGVAINVGSVREELGG